jgi:protocatechuate 3,4-dioxygenase alpha subunit
VSRLPTPAQTVGPFLSLALAWPDGPHVVGPGTPGAIRVGGRLLDGDGAPVTDAVVETWQADPAGRFDHPDDPRGPVPGFRGFGRCLTNPDGEWHVVTCKPGALPAPGVRGGTEAPHLDVSIFARGLLHRLVTRIYFGDEEAANATDPVLRRLDAPRRATLVAAPVDGGYTLDLRLQGPGETVFFCL